MLPIVSDKVNIPLPQMCWLPLSGSFISIDEALHYVGATPEAVEIGKIAIIQEILRAEGESKIRIDRQKGRPDIDIVDGCWIAGLLSMALAEIQRGQLQTAFEKVTFINFNYDRAIEHYLYWALQEPRASATADEARQIVEGLNIDQTLRLDRAPVVQLQRSLFVWKYRLL